MHYNTKHVHGQMLMCYLRKSEDITPKNAEQNVYIVVLQNTFMYGI